MPADPESDGPHRCATQGLLSRAGSSGGEQLFLGRVIFQRSRKPLIMGSPELNRSSHPGRFAGRDSLRVGQRDSLQVFLCLA